MPPKPTTSELEAKTDATVNEAQKLAATTDTFAARTNNSEAKKYAGPLAGVKDTNPTKQDVSLPNAPKSAEVAPNETDEVASSPRRPGL